MQPNENTPLLSKNNGLTLFFAVICIVDVSGVFPVIALPKPIMDCGLYGILVVCFVCFVQIYTAVLLGKCWTLAEEIYPEIVEKNRYPYSALAELTLGKRISYWVTFLLDLTVFIGGIPNLIVAAQNLQLLGLRMSNDRIDVSFCYWIIILGALLCPVLWLGSPKDMKFLCTISVLIVTAVFLLTCSCLLSATAPPPTNHETSLDLWKTIMVAYGIVAFQYDIHPTVLTIQMDMNAKGKLTQAVIGGFSVSLLMFTVTTIITTVKYGGSPMNVSILETLPSSLPLHIAALLVAAQLCLTSAVSNSALYQHLEDCLKISRDFNYRRCILRTILTILAIVIAESLPRFDLVMSLIGGTLTGPLVFILPPLFYIKISSLHENYLGRLKKESSTNIVMDKEEYFSELTEHYATRFDEQFGVHKSWLTHINRKIELVFCILIILVSSLATCVTTYLNVANAALSYGNFSKPCIYNISNAILYL